MKQNFKDVTIGGRTFRIDVMNARVADWVITAMGSGAYSNRQTYAEIQDELLTTVSVYGPADGNGGVPVPMRLFAKGKWLDPEVNLDKEPETLTALLLEAMDFNLNPILRMLKAKSDEKDKLNIMSPGTLQ